MKKFKIGDKVQINLEAEINKEDNIRFCRDRVDFLKSKKFHVITELDNYGVNLLGYDRPIDHNRVELYKPYKISWNSVK